MGLKKATVSLAAVVGLGPVGMALGGPAGPSGGRSRAEERGRNRRRLADLRPDARRKRATARSSRSTPATVEPARAGLVLRPRIRRRRPGSDAAGLERHRLRHHQLERRVRGRRAHRQGALALGSGSESDRRAPEDLLRRRESRHRALRRQDHRAGHRRPAAGARRRDRQAGVGSARRLSAGPPHDHDGAAHRQGQGDHRRQRRRSSDARVLRRLRCGDRTARVAVLHGARRSVQAVRERGDEEGGRDLGRRVVEARRRRRGLGRHGVRPGGGTGLRRHRQRRAVGAAAPHRRRPRTISMSARSSRCMSTPAS